MDNRRTQIYTHNQWVDIEFKNLKHGDKFKLYESTGELVFDDEGCHCIFIATSDAYLNKDGIYTVDILLNKAKKGDE